jgi:hypothetical protein
MLMNKRVLLLPGAVLLLAALACAVPDLPIPTGDGSLFKDDFSGTGGGWGTGTDTSSSVEFANGKLVYQLFEDNYFTWSNPDQNLENIHLEVTAENVGGGQFTEFGLICSYLDRDRYYYLAIDSEGFYAIWKSVPGGDDQHVILSGGGEWTESSDIPVNAASYRIGADCGNGTVTLYVDGKQIDTAQDSEYTKGDVGLFVWTGDDTSAEVHFDDFVVTSLTQGQ